MKNLQRIILPNLKIVLYSPENKKTSSLKVTIEDDQDFCYEAVSGMYTHVDNQQILIFCDALTYVIEEFGHLRVRYLIDGIQHIILTNDTYYLMFSKQHTP